MSYDWHNTQNNEYLQLLLSRLTQSKLIWVQQFRDIINSYIKQNNIDHFSIKDIGCNVGHFCRILEELNGDCEYHGYDISDTYLDIAKDNFKDLHFINLNIEDNVPLNTDITVISATFEHINKHGQAIKNIFDSTNKLIILRTFIGNSYLEEECKKNDSLYSYVIKQFTIGYFKTLLIGKWDLEVVDDIATESTQKCVCSNIYRTQKILIFRKL